jgi:hypothetical protein
VLEETRVVVDAGMCVVVLLAAGVVVTLVEEDAGVVEGTHEQ